MNVKGMVVLEAEYRYDFPRPQVGEVFSGNSKGFPVNSGTLPRLTSGEEVVQLYTGWESGDVWFVVPVGATRLELVDAGNPYRCDRVRFV